MIKDVDLELSEKLSERVHARDRDCFRNSVMALVSHWKNSRTGAYYVEGYAVGDFPMVTLHGWVEHKGRVIETTPTWLGAAKKGRVRYYPAKRYAMSEVRRRVGRKGTTLPLQERDWTDDKFIAARLRATLDTDGEQAFRFIYDRPENNWSYEKIYETAINYDPEAA